MARRKSSPIFGENSIPKSPLTSKDLSFLPNFNDSTKSKPKRDSRRSFTQTQKHEILKKQNYKCAKCGDKLDLISTHFHHKKPWAEGGRTVVSNGLALCTKCHSGATHKERLKKVDKKRTKRNRDNPFPLF